MKINGMYEKRHGRNRAVEGKKTPTKYKNTKDLVRFFFDLCGAKKKLGKKKRWQRFRRLRTAMRATRPQPRRLLKKAGENF